LNTTRTPN